MSGNPRGRGGDRGGGRGRGDRGGSRGGSRGGRGDGGGRGGGRGRGDFQQLPIRQPPGSGAGGIFMDGAPVPQPDPQITKMEDDLVKETRDREFSLGVEGAMVPGRRGYGTQGTKITLRTNYLKIESAYESGMEKMDQTWYRYRVDVAPEPSKQKRRRLLKKITAHPKFEGITWASDMANIIVTTKKLDLGSATPPSWQEKTTIPAEGAAAAPAPSEDAPDFVKEARERNTVTFKVTETGLFSLRQIIDYLRSTRAAAEYQGSGDIVQLANIIMCKPPNTTENVSVGTNNKFYPHEGHPGVESYDLGGGLEALRGYYSSVRPVVGRLLVNINVTSGAFYKPGPLIELMREVGGSMDQKEVFLRRVKVKASYAKPGSKEPAMHKIKTIVGFAKPRGKAQVKRFGNANEVKFQYKDRNSNTPARPISVFDYFRTHHGITLQRPELPVLNVGTPADPQYMPAEICTVLPGQAFNRLLSGDATTFMLKFAARYPNLNAMSILGTDQAPGNGVRLFRLKDPGGNPQAQSVHPWGFRVVGNDYVTVPGRILSTPQVKYASKQENPRGGSWNCANQKFFKPGRIGTWQVLIINLQGPRGNALQEPPEPMIGGLQQSLQSYGIQMGQRQPTQTITLDALTPNNRASNNRIIEQMYQKADERGVRFMLVILPMADKWLYARIKYYGDIKFGVHTINAVGSKISKTNGQGMYFGNLALKFNVKGGGINHIVPNTLMKPLDNNTMLVGIDVTHPSPGSTEGAPSVSAVVASVDEHLTQWPGSVRTQTGRQEMVDGLDEMVVERLNVWQKHHQNKLPTKIILYRDGVSEGQYDQVLRLELPSFHKAFEKRYGAPKNWPKMAVLVVGKRHHTRFYPTSEAHADVRLDNRTGQKKGNYNPLPGTIVDRHIASRTLAEYWLQAHQGLQGTARPAHYVVLRDEIKFEADELQKFTHQMCYLFCRATKAVSICPPAYYADLLCERARAYLYSTLAEAGGGSEGSVFDAGEAEWTRGVHPRLAESTWYI